MPIRFCISVLIHVQGNGRAAMLCCVSPCSNVLEETTHALKFAAMAREVGGVWGGWRQSNAATLYAHTTITWAIFRLSPRRAWIQAGGVVSRHRHE